MRGCAKTRSTCGPWSGTSTTIQYKRGSATAPRPIPGPAALSTPRAGAGWWTAKKLPASSARLNGCVTCPEKRDLHPIGPRVLMDTEAAKERTRPALRPEGTLPATQVCLRQGPARCAGPITRAGQGAERGSVRTPGPRGIPLLRMAVLGRRPSLSRGLRGATAHLRAWDSGRRPGLRLFAAPRSQGAHEGCTWAVPGTGSRYFRRVPISVPPPPVPGRNLRNLGERETAAPRWPSLAGCESTAYLEPVPGRRSRHLGQRSEVCADPTPQGQRARKGTEGPAPGSRYRFQEPARGTGWRNRVAVQGQGASPRSRTVPSVVTKVHS